MTALKDQASRKRIEDDLDTNLCVEAAAGTGKTTVLVRRVVNLLASGRVNVDQLVVITFTEKAAAELSSRVRDELERRAMAAAGEERERLLRAAADLYRAHIETIHSFATALLRERPVEAEIDPLFDVLEEVAANIEFDSAYEQFQDQLLNQNLPELNRALRRGFSLDELREACQHLNAHRYLLPLNIPPIPEGDSDLDAALSQIKAAADELRAMLVRHNPPGDDKAVPVIERIVDWVDRLLELPVGEQERWLTMRTPPKPNKGVGSDANWGGQKQRLKDLQDDYWNAVGGGKDELRANALLGLLPHVERFVDEYAKQRKAAGLADFDDLLFWARDLLRSSPPARNYFRRRFRSVLIDEFQDTDPVQAELALLLTSDQEPNGHWAELTPIPGGLTVVGDPKQSIYRFRRADIAVYDQVRTHALRDGQERISTNFRSNPRLLRALNGAFDRILQAEPGLQPGNVPLDAPPGADAAKRAPVILALGSFEGRADETRREEARVIAAMLHSAHSEGWQIRDRHRENQWRDCRWGDMAILVPARTGIEHYEQQLASAGIPYRHEGSRDFFERDEVRDLIWVMAAVDDPTDRVALIGALRSSAFAVSDDQLVIHAASGGAMNYRARTEGASEPVIQAFTELRDLHKLRRSVSLGELVRRVVERTRLVEFALTKEDGEQGAANLLAIIDDARLFAAAGGGGLRPFIRHLRDSMTREAIEIEATVAEETDDVVRIMTAHGAKGLEFPIVALGNLGSQHSSRRAPVPREQENFLEFHVGAESKSRHGHFPTPNFETAWEEEKQYIEAERLRLLYVAATRARDHLIVPCVCGTVAAKDLQGELVRALPDDPELVERRECEDLQAPQVDPPDTRPVSAKQVDQAVAKRADWAAARRELRKRGERERQIDIASSRERATGPLAAEVSTFASALLIGDGPPIPVGDAVHMVMERVRLPGAEDLEQVVEDVCLEGAIKEQLDDVLAMCRACLKASSVTDALTRGSWWREVPFVLSHNEGTSPLTSPLTAGRVDMVYRDGDELVVVDYKTDKGVTEQNAEQFTLKHHAGQAEAYQQALAAATGLPVKAVVFVYCRAGIEARVRDGSIVD